LIRLPTLFSRPIDLRPKGERACALADSVGFGEAADVGFGWGDGGSDSSEGDGGDCGERVHRFLVGNGNSFMKNTVEVNHVELGPSLKRFAIALCARALHLRTP